MTTQTAPFASVRNSRNYSLVGFGVALLTAAALSLGAFLPRLPSAETSSPSIAAAPTAPVAVASR